MNPGRLGDKVFQKLRRRYGTAPAWPHILDVGDCPFQQFAEVVMHGHLPGVFPRLVWSTREVGRTIPGCW